MDYLEDISLKKLITLIKNAIKGKVDKSGDTMSGNLTLEKSAPYLTLKHTTTGRQGRMAATGDNYFSLYNEDSDDASNNKVALWLAPESVEVNKLLRINHVLDGVSKTYEIYHEGNKAHIDYTANIGTTWTGSAAPYTQEITVTGITANDKPLVDVTMSGTYTTDQARLAEWNKIYRIVTAANKITVYATAKTTAELPIQLQVVR